MKILRLQRQRQYLLLRQIEFQKPISQSHFQAQRDIGPVKVTSTCRTRKNLSTSNNSSFYNSGKSWTKQNPLKGN